jgi:hypothetical protein
VWLNTFANGRRALDEGRADEAARIFEGLVAEADDASAAFNLGLAYKLQRRWPESARANLRSIELEPTPEAFWNLGVAATAVRQWATARLAWHGLGVALDPDDPGRGPPRADCGLAAVRLNATGPAGIETVWGDRIDPCRMVLLSVPLPESGHRWRDVVLHDVVPIGKRHHDGRDYSVFDEIERMEPSEHPTHEVIVSAATEADAHALAALFDEAGLAAEDWTESIEFICPACSRSRPHGHDPAGAPTAAWVAERRFGLGGPRRQADALLRRWARGEVGRSHGEPEEVG